MKALLPVLVGSLLACASAVPFVSQVKTGWPPITPEDLAMQDNPARPGSSAMILLKKENRDDTKRTWETFLRIKIFTEQGREYGNIEIPYVPKAFAVAEIAARVIQTDGRSAEFNGPIYEKTLARQGKSRLMAKTFSLPDIRPGAIVDYRYVMKSKSQLSPEPWIVQEKLYIRKVELEWLRTDLGIWRAQPRSLPESAGFTSDPKTWVARAALTDIPAFEAEPFMPPEEMVTARYVLYRSSANFLNPLTMLGTFLEDYIGKPSALTSAVKELTSERDSPEDKVRKIYRAVQERVRNLSYEETYTKQERKREDLKERKSAADVWRLGYGADNEIALLFAALCRAAGFTADPIGVVQRDGQFYDPAIPRVEQINGWLVAVELPAGSGIFDPGVRFAHPGQISWAKQGVKGIRFGARQADVDISLGRPDQNQFRRRITLAMQADGSANASIEMTYSGEDAIERRNDFYDLPKEEREELLRTELKTAFPAARIQEIAWEGMDDTSEAARVRYRFTLDRVGQILGSRMLVEPRLFDRPSPFPNWTRTHPVYLRRSNDVVQEVRILPPAGYELEFAPESKEHRLTLQKGTPGLYASSTTRDGGALVHVTRLTTSPVLIAPEEYLAVKGFYDQIAASERTHVILRKQ
jgi:hypothetical protein